MESPKPAAAGRPPFRPLAEPFLRRTAMATVVTLGLVALNVALYKSPAWAGCYLVSGVWALGFFALTPLIIKAFMFDRRPMQGLLLSGGKIVWMGLMLVMALEWSLSDQPPVVYGTAMIAGITTPLIVVVLRAIGGKRQPAANPDRTPPPASEPRIAERSEAER